MFQWSIHPMNYWSFQKNREDYKDAEFICDDNGKYKVYIEKMSKSKYNVVTQMIFVMNTEQTLCVCNEMFLGPLEQAKPWNTAGISGVFGFLKTVSFVFRRTQFDRDWWNTTKDNLKTLHKTIKKVADDIYFSIISLHSLDLCQWIDSQGCHSRAVLDR
jgi:leucyl-tRNA synthetase